MNTGPEARRSGLHCLEAGDELVVYDEDRSRAHSLNPVAAFVWRTCDGGHSIQDIVRAAGERFGAVADEPTVLLALRRLESADLLVRTMPPPAGRLTRRQVLRGSARVAGAVAVAALVTTVVAPTPAYVLSHPGCVGLGGDCDPINHCCSGLSCVDGVCT